MKPETRKNICTIPNLLTLIRLLAVPFIMWQILARNAITALIILALASATDLFDGYIARRFNQVSEFGKVFDPFADKVMHTTTLICLAVIGFVHWAFPVVLFAKELLMVLGGTFLMKKDSVIQANRKGKNAAAVLTLGIVIAFFVDIWPVTYWIATAILSVGIVLAFVAFADYLQQFRQTVKKDESASADEGASTDGSDEGKG